jgi:hypothetical protein
VQALLHESLGRPGQAESAPSGPLPRTAEELRKLSWAQMNLIFATQFATEISAVTSSGDKLLRQRLECLNEEQRRVLRKALDESVPT